MTGQRNTLKGRFKNFILVMHTMTFGIAIRTALLLGILAGLFLLIGFIFGGLLGATIGFSIALIMNFLAYWFSDSFVLRIYRAKRAGNEYKKIDEMIVRISKKSGIPKPPLYFVDTDVPNAFATGRSYKHSAVAVTKGLLEKLDDDEIEAVLAHEISHIKHRDTLVSTMAATLAGALTWLAYVFYFGNNENRGIFSYILLFFLAPLAATLIRLSISRNREYMADLGGAKIIDPNKLASALEKISSSVKQKPMRGGNSATSHLFIVNPFSAGNMTNLFSTHPPVEERIKRLKIMAK